jgi:uncharacterized BrkB/YihY/UPF0761 family membrane protein
MAEVWNVPQASRPGFLPRLGRNVAFVALLGVDVVLTTFLAGLVTLGHGALWFQILATLVGLAVNIGLYAAGFRILTPPSVTIDQLLPGAVVGGVGWTILQYVGTLLVGHTLKNASQTYGFFGSVLGLISFLYLAAELCLYAAEVNVVRARHLYPRSLSPPPLTPADRVVLGAEAQEEERRPGQNIRMELAPDASRG